MDSKMMTFVNRIGTDAGLRRALEMDFEGTIAREGLALDERELASLREGWKLLRQVAPDALEARLAAGILGC